MHLFHSLLDLIDLELHLLYPKHLLEVRLGCDTERNIHYLMREAHPVSIQ
jgi:hypothetical protein